MDYKKTNAPTNTVTRNMADFVNETGNVYESIAIIGKRSNQIAAEMKEELLKKLNELCFVLRCIFGRCDKHGVKSFR